MQVFDEQDALPAGLAGVVNGGLHALLGDAAVVASGDDGSHIERKNVLAGQRLRRVAVGDALGQPCGDRGLADARRADEERVVLVAPAQHVHQPVNLSVAADHRVEQTVPRKVGQAAAKLAERPRPRDVRRAGRCLPERRQRAVDLLRLDSEVQDARADRPARPLSEQLLDKIGQPGLPPPAALRPSPRSRQRRRQRRRRIEERALAAAAVRARHERLADAVDVGAGLPQGFSKAAGGFV